MNYTRFTNLEATNEFKTPKVKVSGLTADLCDTTSDDAAVAAGATPTKAEFDAVVALANELKEKHNALALLLRTGAPPAEG